MGYRTSVAIVGFAHGHVNLYCEEWYDRPELGIKVVAGWDHDESRLRTAKEKFGFESYNDLDEMLAREDVGAVIIAAETSMHADLVERAAAQGKSVVLQKPIALTLSEADRIVAAVRQHGVPFTMAWQMRVDPQNVKMKQMLDSGELGQVFMVRRRHGLGAGLQPAFADTWHVDPAYNRDIWADDSAHPIDFIHWLLGVPDTITAEVESLFNPRIPMDNGIAIFRYGGGKGLLAEVNCSFTCLAGENTTEIVCERGTIVQNYGDAVSCNAKPEDATAGLRWYTSDTSAWTTSEITSPPAHGHRIRGLAEPLADFLNGKREPLATAEEGRTSLRMVLATYVSSREGRRVRLDDPAIEEV